MTAVVIHRIRCDARLDGDIPCWTEHDCPLPTRTVGELRAWLKTTGWHRSRAGRDICPDCWAEGRR